MDSTTTINEADSVADLCAQYQQELKNSIATHTPCLKEVEAKKDSLLAMLTKDTMKSPKIETKQEPNETSVHDSIDDSSMIYCASSVSDSVAPVEIPQKSVVVSQSELPDSVTVAETAQQTDDSKPEVTSAEVSQSDQLSKMLLPDFSKTTVSTQMLGMFLGFGAVFYFIFSVGVLNRPSEGR